MKTQVESGKYIKVGDTKVFNTELIYTRVILVFKRFLEKFISIELSPVPTAMFSESSEIKVANLKKVLQKKVSSRCIKKAISTVVIDASAILYLIPWPASCATVGDFVVKFRNFIKKQLQSYDVHQYL